MTVSRYFAVWNVNAYRVTEIFSPPALKLTSPTPASSRKPQASHTWPVPTWPVPHLACPTPGLSHTRPVPHLACPNLDETVPLFETVFRAGPGLSPALLAGAARPLFSGGTVSSRAPGPR